MLTANLLLSAHGIWNGNKGWWMWCPLLKVAGTAVAVVASIGERDGRGRVGLMVAEAVATSVREESKKSGKEEQQKTTRKIDPLVEKSIVLQSRQNNYNLSVEYDSATARYTTLKFDITSGLGGGGGQRR